MHQDTDLLELFHAAVDLPLDEQRAFIERRCGQDAALRERLERLLRLDRGRTASFLRSPGEAFGGEAEDLSGKVIDGKYRVESLLGEGGMGVVYLAEQERPHRRVALKLIRLGLTSERQLRRFELETELLARLGHPGIAQIYDAGNIGTPGSPRPYFAMEYVRGLPLLEHVHVANLGVRERLDLMVLVCDAVQHAHQRGIVHRDLKPGNILVDESGRPKVLDFGVARATDADLPATMQTRQGQLIGTFAYMSPEQVQGRTADVDTRSDVYALGVILFQLLADRLPYDLADHPLPSAARVIAEEEPSSLTTVSRSFRGDLDTIARTAMEKEPQRRYQSASALAADIRRYLNDEPIVARPTTAIYQLRKFARRNRALVAGIVATFVVLVAGTVASTTFAFGQTRALAESKRQEEIASNALDESEKQRAIAVAVNDFLTEDLIELADPDVEADRGVTLSEALDRAVGRIEGRFAGAPLAEANLRRTIGKAYSHLHRLDEAQAQLERATDLYRAELGERDEETLLCRMELLAVASQRAEFVAIEPAIRELLALQREVLGDEHEQTMASLNNLGAALIGQGRYAEAEPIVREALDLRLRVLGEMNEHTATTMNNLSVIHIYTGRFQEAVESLPRTLEILREVSGPHNPQTLQTMVNLGVSRFRIGQLEEAARTLEEALELHRLVLGEQHRSTLGVASSLASLYGRLDRGDEREDLLTATIAAQREVLGEVHFDTLVTRLNLAKVTFDRDDFENAAADYAGVAAAFEANHPDHFLGSIARSMLGSSLMELERYDEAERELTRAYDRLATNLGPGHRDAVAVARRMADLYERTDRPEQAEQWNATAETAESARSR